MEASCFYGTIKKFEHDRETNQVTMTIDDETWHEAAQSSDVPRKNCRDLGADCKSPGRCTITQRCLNA